MIMSKFSKFYENQRKVNENQRNHDERISNHDERISNHDELISNHDELISDHDELISDHDERISDYDERISDQDERISDHDERISDHDELFRIIGKVIGLGDFMAVTSPLPSLEEFQRVQRQAGPHQFSPEPVIEKTIQSNPQNTPEKKNRRKDLCSRLVAIHDECGMTAKDIQKHAKDKGNNWRRIKKAAQLEITDTNEGQSLPYLATIAEYALRIHCALDFMVLDARLNNELNREEFYKSRANQLIAIWFEIDKANPRSLAKLKEKYANLPEWDERLAIRAS